MYFTDKNRKEIKKLTNGVSSVCIFNVKA